jgi:predicted RNA-binding protein YlxR (DUF448 family)
MTKLLNSSLKRQKRFLATKRDDPLRQCCVCKKVLPKDELMRLIKPQTTDAALYDHASIMHGRGIYICPGTDCLDKTIKGKNSRLGYSKVDIDGFKDIIKSKIVDEIIKGINICSKMGYIQKSAEEPIDPKDYLIEGDNKTADSRKLVEKARRLGIKIFNLQGNCGNTFIETAVVKGNWPLHKKMLRNLERFQSLSFRGAVV